MRVFPSVALAIATLSGCSFGLDTSGGVFADPATDLGESEHDDGPVVGDDDTDAGGADGGPSSDEALPSTAVDLGGNLYAIPPDALHVAEPPGLDAIFDQVLNRPILVYVAGETATEIDLQVTLAGASGRQDPCETVRSFPAGDWTQNPVFDVGPGELTTSFGGTPATFRHLEMSGVFDEYASAWRDGTLAAQLDAREIPQLGSVRQACDLVVALGGECEACDDGETACFALRIDQIVAELVDDEFDSSPDRRSCSN